MEYRMLAGTGVRVSPLCLGAMMFGSWGNTDEAESIRIIHRALDSGINFFDTADVYSRGQSEEIVGRALKGRRDQIVLATKVHGEMGDDPNERGNSRRWIMQECEASLRRLGTDWIDLYQIHRWDETRTMTRHPARWVTSSEREVGIAAHLSTGQDRRGSGGGKTRTRTLRLRAAAVLDRPWRRDRVLPVLPASVQSRGARWPGWLTRSLAAGRQAPEAHGLIAFRNARPHAARELARSEPPALAQLADDAGVSLFRWRSRSCSTTGGDVSVGGRGPWSSSKANWRRRCATGRCLLGGSTQSFPGTDFSFADAGWTPASSQTRPDAGAEHRLQCEQIVDRLALANVRALPKSDEHHC